jgi:CubicO group peptidase (beta-lactamase class C family)
MGAAVLLAVGLTACARAAEGTRTAADDGTPQSVEELQEAAARILAETGVPGAGIALVRRDGVEWAGGVGHADRDARTPVTAETHFRVGSISKSFVAMALVQLYEAGEVDLESPIEEVDPGLAIDNPWRSTDPVRVIHVLQHTAGFDDMHLNDRYVPDGAVEGSLDEALALNPGARRVRWRPGTRMAYSNVGYGVAGALIEKVTQEPYEDYIARAIFAKLDMPTSSFRLTPADEARLARGYDGPDGPPVGFPHIYLRPAGNLHSSPGELAQFVRMILNWGEIDGTSVVDPEYLGSMELPRTTLAAAAGLRNGYGTGIRSRLTLPYRVLGHDGGMEGFVSSYGYSPSRDVGFVVLLNSSGPRAPQALSRISSAALRYLKRDVAPPEKPEVHVDAATLDGYTGYYHDANPRHQLWWPIQSLAAGRTIARDGEALYSQPVIGSRVRLIPVTESSFRLEDELDASRVFTRDADGTIVLAGGDIYAEQRPRWRVELVRVPALVSLLLIASTAVTALAWIVHGRRARPRGFWGLKLLLIACLLALLVPAVALELTPGRQLGARNAGTLAIFAASLAIPLLAALVAGLAVAAFRREASRWLTGYAFMVAAAMAWISMYLGAHGLLGLRLWNY